MVAKYFHSVMKIGEDISKTQLRRFLILWECYSDETLDILDMKVAALYRELAKKRMGVQNMKQKEKSVVLQGITSLEEAATLAVIDAAKNVCSLTVPKFFERKVVLAIFEEEIWKACQEKYGDDEKRLPEMLINSNVFVEFKNKIETDVAGGKNELVLKALTA
uniref:Uncharacterized protein n=1 Tax=Chromera velia CCMP2878 TaxID=1169474 RepID=A0A0G4I8C9_9ALVE|eukprot:Cvel_11820.t1-p1 / transcript=Cvel_11820.t1 / gene=Cvel_11820 / organism=Chromera_velia_CCMP2878 / gene_product=hypothetical protein / transcript_product=hypothetical protein / location=Cvel_scaffold752:42312-43620(-) / protein_length=162 / sequence_SO=supercontig / SO=protein_coding / is_pseudo=false